MAGAPLAEGLGDHHVSTDTVAVASNSSSSAEQNNNYTEEQKIINQVLLPFLSAIFSSLSFFFSGPILSVSSSIMCSMASTLVSLLTGSRHSGQVPRSPRVRPLLFFH